MTDPDRTVELLGQMHERGLKLAIDDFGTGASSLARLKHMPVDILKIDRSFVREVNVDADAASMVSAMISLAGNLGMMPLAEGIETEGEWRFLADRGVSSVRATSSRPVPAGDILAMHRRASLRSWVEMPASPCWTRVRRLGPRNPERRPRALPLNTVRGRHLHPPARTPRAGPGERPSGSRRRAAAASRT